MIVKLGIEQYVLKLYEVYVNDDPELTLTYFTIMSNLAKLCTCSRPRYQVCVYRTICPLVFCSVSVAEWLPFGKKLLTRLTICFLCILTICNISYFPFWF